MHTYTLSVYNCLRRSKGGPILNSGEENSTVHILIYLQLLLLCLLVDIFIYKLSSATGTIALGPFLNPLFHTVMMKHVNAHSIGRPHYGLPCTISA